MSQNLLLAIKAARASGSYLLGVQQKGNIDVSWKHEGENHQEPLTKFDEESQRIIQGILAPSDLPFWGEESEETGRLNGWVVDPIDGTGSFANGDVSKLDRDMIYDVPAAPRANLQQKQLEI